MIDLLSRIFAPLTTLMSDALELFHTLGAPWWLSIVFLTVLVRGVLFPLTLRQVKNMRAMQELRPEMDEIRARHKNDRQKQQETMVQLYRERKVNPMAGLLPIVIQVPVFITIYHVIRDHEETFQSFASGGILWFTDLTIADPYFILPVLSATILVAAGEVSSRNVIPSQKTMMRLMPLMFTVFIARFPAGLFVYWITSNTFTLAQNFLIYCPVPDRASPLSHGKIPKSSEGSTVSTEGNSESGSADLANVTSTRKANKPRGGRRKKKKRKR